MIVQTFSFTYLYFSDMLLNMLGGDYKIILFYGISFLTTVVSIEQTCTCSSNCQNEKKNDGNSPGKQPNAAETPVCTTRLDSDYRIAEKLFEMDQKIKKAEEEIQRISSVSAKGSGSVYVRWGRTTCPENVPVLYNGYIGGKKYSDSGSGSNHLCMPSDPEWANHTNKHDSLRAYIYGSEIDITEPNEVFGYAVLQQDIPCAVCRSLNATTVMIPARVSCYPGLKYEYSGYLMSNRYSEQSLRLANKGSDEYICVDSEPEFVPEGGTNDDHNILYLVEAQCGSLPCPPYVQGREVACVVCSLLSD